MVRGGGGGGGYIEDMVLRAYALTGSSHDIVYVMT